jgi:hypothetical protein
MPEYLFHYTKLETAIKILDSGNLRAGKFSNSNDPMEDISITSFSSEEITKDTYEEIEKKLNEGIKNAVNFLSFSEGNFHLESLFDSYNPFVLEENRPGYFYPRMWGQYGDQHKGACLIFDKDSLLNSISIYKDKLEIKNGKINYLDITKQEFYTDLVDAFKVDYKMIQKTKIYGYLKQFLDKYYEKIYFQKDIDWELEREFRILFYPKIFSDNNSLIEIPIINAFKGIVFGSKCDTENILLSNYLKKYDVDVEAIELCISDSSILVSKY